MLCRLCIRDCGDAPVELFDANGRRSSIYNVAVKYFENQFKRMEDIKDEVVDGDTPHRLCEGRVICGSCWQHINDFHQWQLGVLAAQVQHGNLLNESPLNFTENVKLEVEVDIHESDLFLEQFETFGDGGDSVKDMGEDPVGVDETKCGVSLRNTEKMEDSGNGDNDSEDDDQPLLARFKRAKNEKVGRNKRKEKIKLTKRTKVRSKADQNALKKTAADKNTDSQPILSEKRKLQRISKTQEYDAFIALHYKEQLPCELCGQVSANFTELHAHFRAAHNTENGFVICCKHKYSQRFHLIEHLRLHLNPQQYQCTECGKCSANTWSLTTHMKLMHGTEPQERPFECEICHKRFAKEPVLRTHMEVHAEGNKDFVCKDCGKGFVLETRLNIHIRNVHSTEYQSVCEQCGKSFRGRYALKYHLLEHSDIGKRKWPCDKCNAQLHSKSSLKRHIRLAHHDGTTAYVCSECGKVTLTEDALRNHKRYVHERERKHKCSICEKAFKTPKNLREHMTTHTGEDLYQCPHCPRTFKVSANMHHHRKRKHPIEWAENNKQRPGRVDFSKVLNKVVL